MRDINGSKPTNFPLDEEKLPFKIPCPDRPPREKLLKLGAMITNRIGLKTTVDDPEYWGLDGVVTDEMVDVALKMGVRKPKTIAADDADEDGAGAAAEAAGRHGVAGPYRVPLGESGRQEP